MKWYFLENLIEGRKRILMDGWSKKRVRKEEFERAMNWEIVEKDVIVKYKIL